MSEHAVGIAEVAYQLPGPAQNLVAWAAEQEVAPSRVQALLANGCLWFHEGPENSDSELIAAAIDRFELPVAQWQPRVRYLVHAHTETFSMPAPPSSILAELVGRYGLQPALAFGICQVACASVIQAVARAVELLQADDSPACALVVTADRVFGNAKHRLRQNGGVQSDGGSAILLARADTGLPLKALVGAASLRNFPRLHDGPTTPANVAAIGRYTWLHTKQLFQQHSQASGLALQDVACFLPINADREYWSRIAQALQLPESRFFIDNVGARGHACCADLAINLVDAGLAHLAGGEAVVACGQSNVGAYAALTLLPPPAPPGPRRAVSAEHSVPLMAVEDFA